MPRNAIQWHEMPKVIEPGYRDRSIPCHLMPFKGIEWHGMPFGCPLDFTGRMHAHRPIMKRLLFLDFTEYCTPTPFTAHDVKPSCAPRASCACRRRCWSGVWAATLLSTSWARNLGFQRARKGLPAKLHQRVISATRHSAMSGSATDYIAWDNAEVVSWLAIDNNAVGWSDTKSPVADSHRAKQWDCRYDYHG